MNISFFEIANLVLQALDNIITEYGVRNIWFGFIIACMFLLGTKLITKKWSLLEGIIIYLFSVYVIFVFEITLLTREPGSRIESNLELMGTYINNPLAISYMVENVLMFIPFGAFMWCFFKRHKLKGRIKRVLLCIGLSFIYSFGIEIVQKITGRGYFQLDDIVLNVFGGFIGYITIVWHVHLIYLLQIK